MKAYVIHGPGQAKLDEVEVPQPVTGEVQIRVAAVGLNHLDVAVKQGVEGPGVRPTKLPHVSGVDVAGWVDDVGPGVEGWQPEDRVVVYPGIGCGACAHCHGGEISMCSQYGVLGEQRWGGLAEYVTVPAANLRAIPAGVDIVAAAAAPATFTTAWRMLRAAGNCVPGSNVLVVGAGGGVATAGLALARACGARVFVTSGHDWKIDRALELGATAGVNHTRAVIDEWAWEVTRGTGMHLVLDSVGAATWRQSIRSLASGGCVAVCGATSGDRPDISIRELYQRHGRIVGAPLGGRPDFDAVMDLLVDGTVEPVIDSTFPLSDVESAFERLASGEQFGKVLVECGR